MAVERPQRQTRASNFAKPEVTAKGFDQKRESGNHGSICLMAAIGSRGQKADGIQDEGNTKTEEEEFPEHNDEETKRSVINIMLRGLSLKDEQMP